MDRRYLIENETKEIIAGNIPLEKLKVRSKSLSTPTGYYIIGSAWSLFIKVINNTEITLMDESSTDLRSA